jgi:uncharacterized membrane protein (UPF0127 family)
VGLLAVAALGCPSAGGQGQGKARAGSDDVTAEDYAAPPLRKGYVTLEDAFGGRHRISVEVADDGRSRTRGLMWRRHLGESEGMIFIFPGEEVQSFWMKNTLIPLDMLFIDRVKKVVGIVEQAQPKTLTPRSVGRPSMYVLELQGGAAARLGVRPGADATFEGIP